MNPRAHVYVVIGAVSPVADKDIPGPKTGIVSVNHVAESPEFILVVDGLDKCIGIRMFLQVIKCIQMHTVENFCGMAFRYRAFLRRKGRLAEKGESRAIHGKETGVVPRISPEVMRRSTASKASVRSLARCWLKAEGESAYRSKKSSSSILMPEEPQETKPGR